MSNLGNLALDRRIIGARVEDLVAWLPCIMKVLWG